MGSGMVGAPTVPPRLSNKSSTMVPNMNSKIKLLDTASVRGDDLTIIAKLSTRNKPWAAPEKQWTATSMEKPIKSARVHAAAPPHHPSFTPQ